MKWQSISTRARCLLLASIGVFALAPQPASAQADSAIPLRIILPVPAGGGLDAFMRAMSDRMAEKLKQPIVIEGRPGAAGNIAAEQVARSAPDGNTVLVAFDSVATVNPFLYPQTVFRPEARLKPVALVGLWGFMLVVNPSINARDLNELRALTRSRPLRVGSSGNGSLSHLALVHLQRETGMEVLHVPYKGAVPGVTDVVGGHIDAMFAISQVAIPLVKSGKLRAFAYSGRNRSPLAPQLPTLAELGVANYDMTGSYLAFVPAGTPEPIVARLYAAFQDAFAQPEIRDRIAQQDVIPTILPAADAAAWIERTRHRWGPLINEFRITAD